MSEVREVTEWHECEHAVVTNQGVCVHCDAKVWADILGPDCRDGKCAACIGDAWDVATDEPTACQCACHDVNGDGAG